jgi:hypothetical protein
MKKSGEHVRVNFGQSPFVFDIDGMMLVRTNHPRHFASPERALAPSVDHIIVVEPQGNVGERTGAESNLPSWMCLYCNIIRTIEAFLKLSLYSKGRSDSLENRLPISWIFLQMPQSF